MNNNITNMRDFDLLSPLYIEGPSNADGEQMYDFEFTEDEIEIIKKCISFTVGLIGIHEDAPLMTNEKRIKYSKIYNELCGIAKKH